MSSRIEGSIAHDSAGGAGGKESLLGAGPDSSGGWKGVVGAAGAMDFGFWRDEHLDGGGWLDAPLCGLCTLQPDPCTLNPGP